MKSSLDKVVSNKTSHATIKANNVVDGAVLQIQVGLQVPVVQVQVIFLLATMLRIYRCDQILIFLLSLVPALVMTGSCSAGKSDGSVAGESAFIVTIYDKEPSVRFQ